MDGKNPPAREDIPNPFMEGKPWEDSLRTVFVILVRLRFARSRLSRPGDGTQLTAA